MSWWNRKELPSPPEVLAPGMCECGHWRCNHIEGRYRCVVDLTATAPQTLRDQFPRSIYNCACQIFILRKDGGGGNGPTVPDDPEVIELKKIAELK